MDEGLPQRDRQSVLRSEGKDGTFRLTGLPPGTYTVAAVHEKYGEQDEVIMLATRQNKTGVEFSFEE